MEFIDHAKSVLTQHHFRLTVGVRKVLELFASRQTFFTAAEVAQYAQINPSTAYRILEKMEETRLIHEFDGRYMVCTDPDNPNEHHFLVCEKCNSVEEIFLDYKSSIAKQLQKEKKFQLKEVHLEFRGICKNCV